MGLEIFNFGWFHGSKKLYFTTTLLIKCERQKVKICKNEIQKSLVSKNYFLMMYSFTECVKIVKVYVVNFNVTIFNRLNIMEFL